jgi:cyclopropane fatty-acyl-phospholipid synthase-like methyltransferase
MHQRIAAPDPQDVYEFFDLYWERCMGTGASDFTEGLYGDGGPASKPLDVAQRDQRAYLLDQGCVGRGTRLLEVGCGLGSLLQDARARGASAVGLAPSRPQARRCAAKGLTVHNLAWQEVGSDLDGRFDVVIANGSLEHYVSRVEAEQGRQEAIYRHFFERCAAWLESRSAIRRVVLTYISFARTPDPREVAIPTRRLRVGSDEFHYRLLERMYRGWYPDGRDQVLRCAAPRFAVVEMQDGTRDYYLTSLVWSRLARRGLLRMPGIVARLVRWWRLDPDFGDRMRCLLYGSWAWQFAGDDPPCRLNRVTLELRA